MIETLNGIVWGAPMIVVILSAGALFSVGTGFFQIRHIIHWLRCTIFSAFGRRTADRHSVTQFQAMSSALAATLGTGNIAGVSVAVASGGAGAVFWMWISAVFGMMTGFAENVLGIYYRCRTEKGEWAGGAMYYISGGLQQTRYAKRLAKPLAAIFAVLCVLSSFGMGNMAQMNSAAGALRDSFGIPAAVTGAVLAAATAVIILGGVKRVVSITEKLVPFMSCFYILGALWIAAVNITELPSVLGAVIEGAFGIDAVGGGVSGYLIKQAVSMGLRRGVFSNEAGLGTSPAAHAAADVREPCIQGMWSIFEVFFDTIVMCTLTAVILLASPCDLPTSEQALQDITLETQYFRLTDRQTVISGGAPLLISGEGAEITCGTAYSTEFTMCVSEGELTFSNIMTVTGVQSVSEDGELLFLDTQKKVPLIESAVIEPVQGAALAAFAFSRTFGSAAGKLLSVAVLMFAFSTVVGWSCFGAQAVQYLFGERAVKPFRVLFVIFTFLGAVMGFDIVWSISDLVNGLMAVPNLIALFILSPTVFRITRNYKRRVFGGEDIEAMLSAYDNGQIY